MSGNKFIAMTIVVEVDPEEFPIRNMIADHRGVNESLKETFRYNIEWLLQEEFEGDSVKAVHLAS